MNAFFVGFERAGVFGLAALGLVLLAHQILDGRASAAWRVWVWRVALLQTALVFALGLVRPAPLRLAVLPPSPPFAAPQIAPENAIERSSSAAPFSPPVASASLASSPNALSDPNKLTEVAFAANKFAAKESEVRLRGLSTSKFWKAWEFS